MIKLVEAPIDPAVAFNSINSACSGSVVFHYALVKQKTSSEKSTTSIEYQANRDALREMEVIAAELRQRWDLEDVLMIRRTGRLAVGEIISLVAASSPNSEDAFEACRSGINRMKKMSSVYKTEMYADSREPRIIDQKGAQE